MYVRIENNQIKQYPTLPKVWNNHINFKSASKELYNSEGFYDVEEPTLVEGKSYGVIEEYDTNKFRYTIIDTPVMSIQFDISKFKGDLKLELGVRMGVLYPMWGVINDNLKTPMEDEHYETIMFFIDLWKNDDSITQSDYDKFILCFENQGIDLTIYTIE